MEKSYIENHIKDLIAWWADALSKKDLAALWKDYDDGVVSYTAGSQLTGKDAWWKKWEECFSYLGETAGVERKELEFHVCDDMAVVYGYSRITGWESTGDLARSWVRLTVCYKKVGDYWKVFHEHYSLPIDCKTEKPVYLYD